jgi:putative membrane protein (TIGR04086 family)
MKTISQTTTTENQSGVISIIKGILIAYVITLLLILIYSILLTYTDIKESTISPVILIITAISILIGSSIGSSKIKKNGLLNGGVIGFTYIIILYIISSFTKTGFALNMYAGLMIIFSILAGMIRWDCRS